MTVPCDYCPAQPVWGFTYEPNDADRGIFDSLSCPVHVELALIEYCVGDGFNPVVLVGRLR